MKQGATEINVEYIKGPINPDIRVVAEAQDRYRTLLERKGFAAEYKPFYDPSWKLDIENEGFLPELAYWWKRIGPPRLPRKQTFQELIAHHANDKLLLDIPSENCRLVRRCLLKNKENL